MIEHQVAQAVAEFLSDTQRLVSMLRLSKLLTTHLGSMHWTPDDRREAELVARAFEPAGQFRGQNRAKPSQSLPARYPAQAAWRVEADAEAFNVDGELVEVDNAHFRVAAQAFAVVTA